MNSYSECEAQGFFYFVFMGFLFCLKIALQNGANQTQWAFLHMSLTIQLVLHGHSALGLASTK